jgi:hypothetical protein
LVIGVDKVLNDYFSEFLPLRPTSIAKSLQQRLSDRHDCPFNLVCFLYSVVARQAGTINRSTTSEAGINDLPASCYEKTEENNTQENDR